MTEQVQCSAGGADWGSGDRVDPAPPTDMAKAVCPQCGAFVELVGRGRDARYAPHAERVPLRDRFGAPPVDATPDISIGDTLARLYGAA